MNNYDITLWVGITTSFDQKFIHQLCVTFLGYILVVSLFSGTNFGYITAMPFDPPTQSDKFIANFLSQCQIVCDLYISSYTPYKEMYMYVHSVKWKAEKVFTTSSCFNICIAIWVNQRSCNLGGMVTSQ